MSVPPESSSAVLVIMRSKSVSICNHSRVRVVDSGRNRTFSRRYQHLMRSYRGLLEPRGSNLTPLKSTFEIYVRVDPPGSTNPPYKCIKFGYTLENVEISATVN